MKLKLICSLVLLFAAMESCKKAVELKNQLVDAYWQNIEGVVLEFSDKEAYVIDAGNSELESDPAVLDIWGTPYIKNIIQTGTHSYTAEIIKTVSANGKITSFSYENTTISLSEENGQLVIKFSNADATASTWTANATNGGSNPGAPPVVRDTTSTLLKDAASSFSVRSSNSSGASTFTNFPVYGRYRPLSYSPGNYYYRMDASVNPYSLWLFTLYFKEKPSATKTYKVVSGDMASMIGVGAGEVGIIWNSYMEPVSGPTVTVSVSGGKITVTGTDIKTESNTAVYDDYLTFKIIGQ
ncbi:MAG TPA: hypothetical protein VFS22_04305 [Flavisolibacter sp.]|nr:hypothetical protein [Flavisolibacter sp.]